MLREANHTFVARASGQAPTNPRLITSNQSIAARNLDNTDKLHSQSTATLQLAQRNKISFNL
jgi:hypothetical protein